MKKTIIIIIAVMAVLMPVFAKDNSIIPSAGVSTTFSFDGKFNVEGIGVFCEVEKIFTDGTTVDISLLVKAEGKLSFQKNSPVNGFYLDAAAGYRINDANKENIGVVKAGLTTEIHKANDRIVVNFGTVAGFNVALSESIGTEITARYDFINKTSAPNFTLEAGAMYIIDTTTP